MSPRHTLFDAHGQAFDLGSSLATGGEGVVSTLIKDLTQLAKVYHQPPDALKVEKLRWMVQQADATLCRFAAWPTATLHDTPGGPLVGFLMPRFDGHRPIHTLYSPAHRRSSFPHADWSFLIHTAMNVAVAFDAIHEKGHLVGDVNQSNVLVGDKALVCLIDCDSFQIQAHDKTFRCEVGVPQYTPSELQNVNFRDVTRTLNHDRFGLAVLIFHLLFMGRHPFAGRYLGKGEMPLEQAIAEFRFVYAANAAATQMAPPPYTLPLSTLSPDLADLFERAFDRGAERDGIRPTAAEWHVALGAFVKQMRTCPQDPGHKIPGHLVDCPWCRIVRDGGPNFFLGAGPQGTVFRMDRDTLAVLWKRIEAQRLKKYQPPTMESAPAAAMRLPPVAWLGKHVAPWFERFGCLTVVVLTVFFCWFFRWWQALVFFPVVLIAQTLLVEWWARALRREQQRRQSTAPPLITKLDALAADWDQTAGRYKSEFIRIKDALKQAKVRYQGLQAQFEAECPRVEQSIVVDKEKLAREQFLRSRFLSDTKIPGIGSGRIVLLASYGIETAYDLTPAQLDAVKGIGPKLSKKLLEWRHEVVKEFHFDPGEKPVARPELEARLRSLVLKYKQMEEGLRAQLQKGAIDLEALATHTEEELKNIESNWRIAVGQLQQVSEDLRASGGNDRG